VFIYTLIAIIFDLNIFINTIIKVNAMFSEKKSNVSNIKIKVKYIY